MQLIEVLYSRRVLQCYIANRNIFLSQNFFKQHNNVLRATVPEKRRYKRTGIIKDRRFRFSGRTKFPINKQTLECDAGAFIAAGDIYQFYFGLLIPRE